MQRRNLLALAAAMTCRPPAFAQAPRPSGRLLFGFPKGGLGSNFAEEFCRLLADAQPTANYQLENVTAGGSTKALELVKSAAPDGRTLLQVQSSQLVLLPSLRRVSFDPLQDFSPISLMGLYTWGLMVGPAVPAQVATLGDYLSWVRENPQWRNFGATLYGSEAHLAGLMLARSKNVSLRAIPYSGTGPLIKDLLDQTLAAGLVIIGNGQKDVQQGRLRYLAVAGPERWPSHPSVPCFKEMGIQHLPSHGWYAWLGPGKLPLEIMRDLSEAAYDVLTSPDGYRLVTRLELQTVAESTSQIQERIEGATQQYKLILKEFGMLDDRSRAHNG